MPLIDHIRACNAWNPDDFVPFMLDGQQIGAVHRPLAAKLPGMGEAFVTTEDGIVTLHPDLRGIEARSQAIDATLRPLSGEGAVAPWRGEKFDVTVRFGVPPVLRIERCLMPVLGCRAYGIHMNGHVRGRRPEDLRIWVATRARAERTFPGQLDHIVAGGHSSGHTIHETMVKEAQEEAAIPPDLAAAARLTGLVSYKVAMNGGLRDDVIFCYDLDLPESFEPRNTDGEVDRFELWPWTAVRARLAETFDFKFNVPLVIIDFLIRDGLLTPESEPDYVQLCAGLRQ